MKQYGCSRWQLFELLDKSALKPLPVRRFEFGTWKIGTVNIDYHIELNRHYYSVPYQLVGKKIEIYFTEKTVAIFHEGQRVIEHLRDDTAFKHTTLKEHMPPSHQATLEWTPSRFLSWSLKLGPEVNKQVAALLHSRQHPEQAYRSCLGLLRLEKKFGAQRLNAACGVLNAFGVASMKRVQAVLTSGHDRLNKADSTANQEPLLHANVRGSTYYH
jgi:transposase